MWWRQPAAPRCQVGASGRSQALFGRLGGSESGSHAGIVSGSSATVLGKGRKLPGVRPPAPNPQRVAISNCQQCLVVRGWEDMKSCGPIWAPPQLAAQPPLPDHAPALPASQQFLSVAEHVQPPGICIGHHLLRNALPPRLTVGPLPRFCWPCLSPGPS